MLDSIRSNWHIGAQLISAGATSEEDYFLADMLPHFTSNAELTIRLKAEIWHTKRRLYQL
ncbi:hypothetical protein [Oceanobacillus senegalensis]|uniref:hypothetical protein n=1 Tax=Oceanobacillus senegalensis TaxID=1936063 RepID=UPI001C4F7558|nr:hypothetical protein [Oceanobacillus senegalensis]